MFVCREGSGWVDIDALQVIHACNTCTHKTKYLVHGDRCMQYKLGNSKSIQGILRSYVHVHVHVHVQHLVENKSIL